MAQKDKLSQGEIDALLDALNSGGMPEIAEQTQNVKLYDFRKPSKFAPEQMRALKEIHDEFIRLVSPAMSTFLRTFCEIEIEYVDEQTYFEYTNSLLPGYLLMLFEYKPLEGNVMIEISNSLTTVMIEKMLGGLGEEARRKEGYTDIELHLLKRIARVMVPSLKEAWANVVEIDPEVSSVETNSQNLHLMPSSEAVLLFTMKMTVNKTEGIMNICIPYGVVEPVIKKLNSRLLFQGTKQKNEVKIDLKDYFKDNINKMDIELSGVLGNTSLSFGDLVMLQPGDVIKLDRHIDDKIDIMVDNIAKFKGVVGNKNGKYAVKVTNVVEEVN